MAVGGNALSRNPNVCASCSSIIDGMEDAEQVAIEKTSEEKRSSPTVERILEEVHNPA